MWYWCFGHLQVKSSFRCSVCCCIACNANMAGYPNEGDVIVGIEQMMQTFKYLQYKWVLMVTVFNRQE